MRRFIFFALIAIPILLFIFGVGAWVAMRLHWGMPIATINVSNESERDIESVTVTYTTCGFTRTLTYRQAEQRALNKSQKVIPMGIVLCGEGSHTTQVSFSNGNTLTSKGFYIEGGYEVTEHVTASGIESEYSRNL
jgi:hypothetical protein